MPLSETTVFAPEAASIPSGTRLFGRGAECQALDRLIADVGTARGQALVLHGEAGVGKTALLGYLAGQASDAGALVLRTTGVPSESDLAFAGLHRLCEPMLGYCERLPAPQRRALHMALGVAEGPAPAPFLLGVAVLGLLAEAAADRPLICLVDDEQWLDQASAHALGFVGRRLSMTSSQVALVFAAREPGAELAGVPELGLGGLREDAARRLLASALPGPLDPRVRDLIVAEARGNPLALLEVPRWLSPAELAGGFGLPGAGPLAGRIEDGFIGQLEVLPAPVRRLLQVAAADPTGDPSLMQRAAGRLGIPLHAGAWAAEMGLVRFDAFVRFRHLLARSAVYLSASVNERRRIHAVLAEVTDPVTDPDRRAWHRARAATGPDEEVAAELERCAARAQSRGGLPAAAAFLEHAVLLTPDPGAHVERILGAAQASVRAGAFAKALHLLATAEAGPLDELSAVRVDLLRGQVAAASGQSGDAGSGEFGDISYGSSAAYGGGTVYGGGAAGMLLKAAKRLARLDAGLARKAYLAAWTAAQSAGSLAADCDLLEVSRAARALPLPAAPRAIDLAVDGLARFVTDGPAEAAPALRRAVNALRNTELSGEEAFRWGWQAAAAAIAAWDDAAWRALLARQAERARRGGALDDLPVVLDALGTATAASGDFTAAIELAHEADTIRAATGAAAVPVAAMATAALRGQQAEAVALIDATVATARASGQGNALAHAHWAAAVLYNGLSRYEEAMAAARQASEDITALPGSLWALSELVEAATRVGDTGVARDALKRLTEITQSSGTDSALGTEARCRALLGTDRDARFREAIDRLSRTDSRTEIARTRLLYGEWLRREGRAVDARNQLREAHEALTEMGMEGFAERARRELRAAGGQARKNGVESGTELTAQEALIARLACDGRTNPEIGTQLFLSARTVGWHLSRVYVKLGISSRRQLHMALAKSA